MAMPNTRNIETDSMPYNAERRSNHNASVQTSTEANMASRFPRGYPELAACMNSDPGLNMFRRFSYLHLRQLLYMQEELAALEQRLHQIDASETVEMNPMSRRFDRNEERRQVMAEIKVSLREYDDWLEKYHRIFNHRSPTTRDITHFRRWFSTSNPIIEEEAMQFNDSTDLCATSAEISDHPVLQKLVSWVSFKMADNIHMNWIFRPEVPEASEEGWPNDKQIIYTSDRRILKVMRLIIALVAPGSLLIPVIVLYGISPQWARLVTIVFFTLVFSSLLTILTRAKPSEIFTATAAYAAVMVVFVGSAPAGT